MKLPAVILVPVLAHLPRAADVIDDFFASQIGSPHTRVSYLRAVRAFFVWCSVENVPINEVRPGHVGRYFGGMQASVPTQKLHLAALRKFFDYLVVRQVLPSNPAASVRLARFSLTEGKTTEVTVDQVRAIQAGIDFTSASGVRDRAIIGVLTYTGARVGAVATLRRRDLSHDGTQFTLNFREKNGKERAIPVRTELAEWLADYLTALDENRSEPESGDAPLFKACRGKKYTSAFTDKPISGEFINRMIHRRCRAVGIPQSITPHSFRVKAVTNLLEAGVALEDVQYLVGHADPRTTRLYDRRKRYVTRSLVDKIP